MANANKFDRAKIYKIWSPSTGLTYYGSTIQRLVMRLGGHRRKFKLHKNGKYNFVTSFRVLECPDHRIDLVEDFPCQNVEQLRAREAHYIRENVDCVNRYIPGRDPAQYRVDNRERIAQYRVDNRERIAQYDAQYRAKNRERLAQYYRVKSKQKIKCECGVEMRRYNIPRHKKTKRHKDYIEQQVLILQAVQEEKEE